MANTPTAALQVIEAQPVQARGHVDPSVFQPLLDVQAFMQRQNTMDLIISKCLKDGVDFRVMPGQSADAQKVLTKAGAEKLSSMFGLRPEFLVDAECEDWTGADHAGEAFFYVKYRCRLWRGDFLLGEGIGSCNSWESKYRYRWMSADDAKRSGLDISTLKSRGASVTRFEFDFSLERKETGGKWGKPAEYWAAFEAAIANGTAKRGKKATAKGREMPGWSMTVDDVQYRVPNPDAADIQNTVLKIGQKRALVAAVLIVTNASDRFTQDLEEDLPHGQPEAGSEPPVGEPETGAGEPQGQHGPQTTGKRSTAAPAAAASQQKAPNPAPSQTEETPEPDAGDLSRLPAELAGFIHDAKGGRLADTLPKAQKWLQAQLEAVHGPEKGQDLWAAALNAAPKRYTSREAAAAGTIGVWLRAWAQCAPAEPSGSSEYQVSQDLEGVIEAVRNGHDEMIKATDHEMLNRLKAGLGEAEGAAKFREMTTKRPQMSQLTIGADGTAGLSNSDKQAIFDSWVRIEAYLHGLGAQ